MINEEILQRITLFNAYDIIGMALWVIFKDIEFIVLFAEVALT
jgi:hypothetical protein